MRVRSRPLAAVGLGAVLALSACGGHAPKAPAAAPSTSLPPPPEVKPAQVKALVGRWVSPQKDYFEFKGDGTGVWKKDGQTLWTGQAIPEGDDKFRFSWQGGDPQTASYWGATLEKGAFIFSGTNQKYVKSKR